MSLYTLKQLLNDCSSRMSRTRCAADKRRETLEDIWRALNDWIDSRFAIGKGIHIATFATIGWEVCTNGRNQSKLRPVFLPSDTFIRTYGLQQKKPPTPPQLSSLEDINFTKIAIKYSKNLTKDLVFCGIRDLLQKIGEVAATGAAMSITFNLGRLIAKNRTVSMIFDPLKFPRGLEEQITRSMVGSSPIALGNLTEFDIAPEDHVDYNSILPEEPHPSHLHGPHRGHGPSHLLLKDSGDALDRHTFDTDDREALPTHRSDPDNVIAFETSLEEELQLFGISGSPARGNPVLESAYRRHIATLAEDVDREAQYAFDLQLQQKRDLDTVALETRLRRQCAEDLQRDIRQQMDESRGKKQLEKTELRRTDPSASSFYSEGEQTRLGLEDPDFRRHNKHALKQQLQAQMHDKEQERMNSRQRHLQDDRTFLRRLRHEMHEIETKQSQERDERRRTLTDAWNRDSAVKKIVEVKKKQRAAEQLHRDGIAVSPTRANFYPHLPQPMTPQRTVAGTRLRSGFDCNEAETGNSDDFSVGFDIRSVCGD